MRRILLSTLLSAVAAMNILAQTTAFSYQGSLQSGGTPANGNFDFEFKLFDAVSAGTQQGSTQQRLNVAVANGIFTVSLDFGAGTLPGANRYLEIAVRTAGGGTFTTLAPRQLVNSAPYAVRSLNTANADSATNATNATNATTAATATNALQLGGVAANQYVLTGDPRMSDPRPPTAGSANYVQNGTSSQAASNFNISGTGTGNIFNATAQYDLGGNRVLSNAGNLNFFAGAGTGQNNTTGTLNAFFGAQAGQNNTTGGINSFFGAQTGQNNTTGIFNSFFGTQAGFTNTIGGQNAFFGTSSGFNNTTGNNNSLFGMQTGLLNTTGASNAFFGYNAGFSNVTGTGNTMLGSFTNVLSNNLTNATAIGNNAAVGASNSLVLGSILGVNFATANTNVGIGTTAPVEKLDVIGNVRVSGAFLGKGAVPWQVVSGLSQQALSNNGYITTNDAQVIITLPANPNIGDVVRASGIGAGGWKVVGNMGQFILPNISSTGENWIPHESIRIWTAVASSADGTKLVATVDSGQIYTSNDSGTSWTPHGPVDDWKAVASSADGSRLVAAPGGTLQTSSDSGNTWTPHGPIGAWFGVASSADGQKLAAAPCGAQIHTSTDFGVTWTPHGASKCWQAVASSADGTKLIAAPSDDGSPNQNTERIYLSNDSGVTWTPVTGVPLRRWWAVASSGNGNTLVAIGQNVGDNWISTDSGVNWTRRETDKAWYRAASSADGTRLVAVVYGGRIYTSTDSGVTWRERESVRSWNAVASSADGLKLVAAGGPGQIYTATILDVPNGRASYVVGGQNSAIELQYVGNGLFLPISQTGSTVAFY